MEDFSNNILLEASHITHEFDYPLFEDISLSIYPQQTIAITGQSGTGKSTLLHILSTLLKPNSGEVSIENQNIYNIKDSKQTKLRREKIGIIFQAHYLFRGFNAIENLEISSILSQEPISQELLQRFKISHVMNQQIGELSGGQQQRLSIARVLTKKPKLIFADEPTGNLDTTTADEVMSEIFDYIKKSNGALVLVTHDDNIAQKCDSIYHLQNNRLMKVK